MLNKSGQLNLDGVQCMVNINLAANAVAVGVKIIISIGQVNAVSMTIHLLNLYKLLEIIRIDLR